MSSSDPIRVPTMAEMLASGDTPEVLFWVGCAGSFDDRAKRITKAFVRILNAAKVKFAVLGTEESCTGDPARRAGNEFVFQMQAQNNIMVMNGYGVKRIVTACPHCFNTLKNEYPALGGNYEVMHHTQFINALMKEGRIKVEGGSFKGKRITFHDPCYLGRHNGEYEAPRKLIHVLAKDAPLEFALQREKAMCCGAGGARMWLEETIGTRINVARTEQALELAPKVIATACPYCAVMIGDGLKTLGREAEVASKDIAELVAEALVRPAPH